MWARGGQQATPVGQWAGLSSRCPEAPRSEEGTRPFRKPDSAGSCFHCEIILQVSLKCTCSLKVILRSKEWCPTTHVKHLKRPPRPLPPARQPPF